MRVKDQLEDAEIRGLKIKGDRLIRTSTKIFRAAVSKTPLVIWVVNLSQEMAR